MSLYLEEEGEITLPFETKEVADLVVEAALEYEGCPYEAEINLLLTTDDEIHRMNEEFRQIDRATDVLSFPMLRTSVVTPSASTDAASTASVMICSRFINHLRVCQNFSRTVYTGRFARISAGFCRSRKSAISSAAKSAVKSKMSLMRVVRR